MQGFTLIELIVAMSVLAILVAIAAPSFQSVFNSNRLTSTANELNTSLQLARMEAVKRNSRVVVCPSANPDVAQVCAAGNGWMTFVDNGAGGGTANNGQHEGAEVVLYTASYNAPIQMLASPAITGSATQPNTIRFSPDGLAYNGDGALLTARLAVCMPTTRPPQNAREVSIAFGSRMNTTRRNTGGVCAAPAN